MIYKVLLQPQFKQDIKQHNRAGDKKLIKKIEQLLEDLSEHPRFGIGKPEPLKGFDDLEIWSRRIDSKHRLVYQIRDNDLIIIAISAFGHYGDK